MSYNPSNIDLVFLGWGPGHAAYMASEKIKTPASMEARKAEMMAAIAAKKKAMAPKLEAEKANSERVKRQREAMFGPDDGPVENREAISENDMERMKNRFDRGKKRERVELSAEEEEEREWFSYSRTDGRVGDMDDCFDMGDEDHDDCDELERVGACSLCNDTGFINYQNVGGSSNWSGTHHLRGTVCECRVSDKERDMMRDMMRQERMNAMVQRAIKVARSG
jgi:hypothetical protein